VILLPAVWLIWLGLAATQTVDGRLTRVTLLHFISCALAFYVGLFALSRVRTLTWLWAVWIGAFALVLASGFSQHFGGLEETRRWFFEVYLPTLSHPPPAEFIQKVNSHRIYATLFYPNTLAGAILLLLPVALAWLWQVPNVTRSAKTALVIMVALASLACLFWSGSKAGWLILVLMAALAFLQWPVEKRIKTIVIVILLAAGLAGFFIKYRSYFTGGATSVVARFDYWKAAWQTLKSKPLFGSGPGTFGVVYKRLKNPESEMSRLAHNDYLQQGSDGGVVALLLYAALMLGSLGALYRKCRDDALAFYIWLGLLGIAVQGFVEFGLFIPALAWPQFLLLGWLWGKAKAE
jgi:O-antigen ligase